jgi:hypothetical protein
MWLLGLLDWYAWMDGASLSARRGAVFKPVLRVAVYQYNLVYMATTVASNCTRRKQLTKECHHPTLHAITGLFLCAISLYRSWYGWTSSITASHRNWFHGSSCFDAGRGTLPSCEWPRNSNCAGAGMSPPASHNRQPGSILLGFLAEWVLVNQDRTCRWIMFSGSGNGAEHAVEDVER